MSGFTANSSVTTNLGPLHQVPEVFGGNTDNEVVEQLGYYLTVGDKKMQTVIRGLDS